VTHTAVVPLGEIADLQAGVGFPLDLQGRTSGDYPVAKVRDISRAGRAGEAVINTADHFVDQVDLVRLKARSIPAGSVLFAKIGEAIRQNHRVIAGCELLVDNNAMAAIPLEGVESRYLFHFLRTVDFYALASATTVPALRKSDLQQLRVPLPPLPEQRRIAEILDKADTLRAKRRAALAQLDTLTQSIFLDMFGDPATNPKGWPQVSIGDHASKIGSGATPRGGEESYKPAGITLIRSMNVRDGGFLTDGLAFIDDEQAAQLEGVTIETDDVLLNITGASVARVCRAPADVLPARVNQHVAIIRPTATFNPHFLEQCLLSPSVKERLLKIARAGATREAITKSAIEQFKVIRPPRKLQDQFAARSNATERIHGQMCSAIAEFDGLFGALQHRAFRGELVCDQADDAAE